MATLIHTHDVETGDPTGSYDLEKITHRYRPMEDQEMDPGRGLQLHRTASGRWAIYRWSSHRGTRDTYATWATDAEALAWLRSPYGGYTDDQAADIIEAHTEAAR